MKIICVGRNYAKHAKELNNPVPDEAVLFLKPETALIPKNLPFFYPKFSKDVHFEAELVYRINRVGKNIQAKFAHKYYSEISLGIDFTARDVQANLKSKGLPWERAKAFDGSAPHGLFLPVNKIKDPSNIAFELKLNGEIRQKGQSKDMLFPIDQLIEESSSLFTLKIGDLIFSGTPEGVGPVNIGDHLEGYIEGEKVLDLKVR